MRMALRTLLSFFPSSFFVRSSFFVASPLLMVPIGGGCGGETVVHDAGEIDSGEIDSGAVIDTGVDMGSPDAGPTGPDYTDDAMWLCRPGKPDDQCLNSDLTATEVHPDGTRTLVTSPPMLDPPYDCFYVYPTVDIAGAPGNHTDFSDITLMLDPLLAQAARFRTQCRVFAPLYRQSTYLGLSGAGAAARLDLAYRDVEAAFREYLARDGGTARPFMIFGHSQGSFMLERLLTDFIMPDAALRARLIVALLIGGKVQVPVGATSGGTLGSLPLCTSDTETGCAVHYHTFAEGFAPTPGTFYATTLLPGDEAACVDPASLAMPGHEARMRAAYFPTSARQAAFDVPLVILPPVATPFILYRDFYAAACTSNPNFRSYLEMRGRPMLGDLRGDPVPDANLLFTPSLLGMHIYDVEFALGDLQALVATKAAAL